MFKNSINKSLLYTFSIEIWSQFSNLVCFNWVYTSLSFCELHFRKESLAHDRLDIIMHENNVLWEVTMLKYRIY